jgi:uncharacterized phage protein gp47/JayE
MNDWDPLAKPGALPYRIGTYDSFLAEMQQGAKGKPQLATLNLQVEGDFTNALMSGWARVCDVLTFYQERIANEGYLPTAVEPASILWLAAEIGEQRKPAVGAQASLALQLIDAAGQPDSLTVEPGPSLAVQNTPTSPDVLPVIFECAERRELRPVWNALAPVIPPVLTPAAIWKGCRSLRLVGTSLGIRPGAALLLNAADGRAWLAIVDTVQVDRTLGCTLITWRDPASLPEDETPIITAVTQFQRSAGLFGRTAMEWADVPDKQKQAIGVRAGGVMTLDQRELTSDPRTPGPALWAQPANAQPPPANIQALLGIGGDALLAGTDRGVFRSTDRGATWQALTLPQPKGWHDVLTLHQDDAGTLYAGTTAGVVLTSSDGGDGWAMMTQTVVPPAEKQGGLFSKPKPSGGWTLQSPIHAIATLSDMSGAPNIYIGTDQGVFAMLGTVPNWQPFNTQMPGASADGAANVSVAAFAIIPGSSTQVAIIYAATNRGPFSADPTEGSWTAIKTDTPAPPECTSMAVTFAGPESASIYVGTSAGIFVLPDWSSYNDGFGDSPPPVVSLQWSGSNFYAATDAGLFQSGDDAWHSLGQDLTLFEMDEVFADGLDKGRISPALSQRFARFGIALDPKLVVRKLFLPISSLGAKVGWELCAPGPPLVPLYRIYAETPLRVSQLLGNAPGPGPLAVLGDGTPVTSLPLGPVVNTEWPDFAIATGVDGAEIYLDRKIDDILPDRTVDGVEEPSKLVLAAAGDSLIAKPEVHKVIASEAILHKAYGKQGIVTRIVVAQTADLLAADPRTANVHVISQPIAPFTATDASLKPLTGATLTLPGVHGDLARGRSLQVSGPRPGAVVVPWEVGGAPAVARAGADAAPALDQQMISPELKAAFTAAGVKLSPAAAAMVLVKGATWLVRDGDLVWQLRLPAGSAEALPLGIYAATLYEVLAQKEEAPPQTTEIVTRPTPLGSPWILQCGDEVVKISEGFVQWQRAASTQASLSEIVTIDKVAVDPVANVTTVTLTAPLKSLYDSALCRICANVVLVTQGETVLGEVLGSGQPAQAGQSFTLHRSPLTFTHDRASYGVHSALEVRVNGEGGRALRFGAGLAPVAPAGEIWNEITSLALAEPAARVFALTTDHAGRATLHFGDGVHGARLPSGSNNVTANYRAGAGAQGNVPAGSLIALRKRPPGIRSATNPAPATGGKNAESIEALRVRAPSKLHCCDRIVTLNDYQAFTREVPGVGHAQAALLGDIVWLTLVTADWQPISQAPELKKELAAAIERHRADGLKLRLEDPKLVLFDVALLIDLTPGADSVQVKRRVRARLAQAFGPAMRDFSESVDPQAVQEVASAVSGVAAAEPTRLYRTDQQPAGVATLAAAPASIDAAGKVQRAEWLVINADSGIPDIGISISVRNG